MALGKILVTGKDIDIKYNRTLIILTGLEKLGYEVIVFNMNKKNRTAAEKIRSLSKGTFFTYLPSFTHKSVQFVKKNSCSDVVFDPLISKYMTNVKDYKSYPSFSYGALRSSYRDRTSLRYSDFVIFDTITHRNYFMNRYNIDQQKTGVVYVGANSVDFKTSFFRKSSGDFIVGFIGHFIPLHGIFNILQAAQKLKNEPQIKFKLIGTGYHFEKAKKYCKANAVLNVEFLGQVKYEELNGYIDSFDLCLGIFSQNIKAFHVIPNKIFNYASCGKAVLTMESPAVKEIFTHNKNIFLCSPNSDSIADSILKLLLNEPLRKELGLDILNLVNTSYTEEDIAGSLINQYKKFKNRGYSGTGKEHLNL